MTPTQLLNRWIVPLDRGIDYLSLNTGVKFDVPFNVKVVFSTNLPPAALGDEAFFRRLPSKVYIGSIQDDDFDEILRRVATAQAVTYTHQDGDYLRHLTRSRGDGDLRPYVPVMVCELVRMICQYEDRPMAMSRDILDRVAEIYFTNLSGDPAKPMSAVSRSDGTVVAATTAPVNLPPSAPPRPGGRTSMPPLAAAASSLLAVPGTGSEPLTDGVAPFRLASWAALERTGTAF